MSWTRKNCETPGYRLVWDSGYRVPAGYTGRVHTGRGLGLDLVTHIKPLPIGTHDLYIHARYS